MRTACFLFLQGVHQLLSKVIHTFSCLSLMISKNYFHCGISTWLGLIWCLTLGGNYASGPRAKAYILSKFFHIETSQKSNIKTHQTNCHPISLHVSQLCILLGNYSKDLPFHAFISGFVLELHQECSVHSFNVEFIAEVLPSQKRFI